MSRFLQELARRPLLLDAAMGTRLIAGGLDLSRDDPSVWCLDHPEIVLDLHRRDVQAGSDAVLTNTFGANRIDLDRYGRSGEVVAINRRAVALARQAAGPDRFVFGSIGPRAAHDAVATREQAFALSAAGADALMLETHQDYEARTRLHFLRGVIPLPILIATTESMLPISEEFLHLDEQDGFVAYGSNCLDLVVTLEHLRRLRRRSVTVPLIAKPSAGLPGAAPASPEAFAAAVPTLLALGVRLIGGCCGTTEAHVAALRGALDRAAPSGQARKIE